MATAARKKHGNDITQMIKEQNPKRLLYDALILMPFITFILFSFLFMAGWSNVPVYEIILLFALGISFMAYDKSVKNRSKLYSRLDRIPADSSFFWSDLFMFILFMIFPSISVARITFFTTLVESLIVGASILALVGVELRKEFPLSDNLSTFFGMIFIVIIGAVISIGLFSVPDLAAAGLAMAYVAILALFSLMAYTFQIIAWIEGFDAKLLFTVLKPKK